MAGMQFEYDDKGGTFYYFLLSFLALILFPATYYLWPSADSKEDPEKQKRLCQCDPCRQKRQLLLATKPWDKFQKRVIKAVLLVGWIAFIFVAYKTSQVELDYKEFDPFEVLGIDRAASTGEIKKAYRSLSLLYHPDKETGDSDRFMLITKAYQALTDEEARKNWMEHGNPDGPGAVHLGIALPKWIVEKQNSVWVLAVYGLVFMVLLPVVVGIWWRRSIKYNADKILMDTSQLYYYFFHKTPNMILKRVLIVLGASMEFDKKYNNDIAVRPSDNEEIPMLMRDLPHLNEKLKERPLCNPYSLKARALIHAHLSRLRLPPNSLEIDKQYMLKKCPYLLNEMVSIAAQLVAMSHAERVRNCPRLETIESVMKASQLIIQGLWENKSPLLQLPHLTEDMLRHFVTKRRNIRTIQQFVSMPPDERRSILRTLSDQEYHDILLVCASMPSITMNVRSEVLDEEDKTITAGSIVTVTVELDRNSLQGQLPAVTDTMAVVPAGVEEVEETVEVEEEEDTGKVDAQSSNKPKVWEKQHKKKKQTGKPAKAKKKAPRQQYIVKKTSMALVPVDASKKDSESSPHGTPNGSIPKDKSLRRIRDDDSDDASRGDSDDEAAAEAGSESEEEKADKDEAPEEDEDDWAKFQEESKKDNTLETKSKETHEVHCPYFPGVKYEWWWLYVCDRRKFSLITAPVQVCSLRTSEEVQLKFSAPLKPGIYQYHVMLRSDSYLDFDQSIPIKLDVKEAKKVESHPQWDISEDEDEDADAHEGSDSYDDSDYDSNED